MTLVDRPLHARTLELAASAIDGPLTASQATELETHLAACPACARTAAAMRTDAFNLAEPLDLLPSRRVDEAVAAAISRRSGRSHPFVLLAAAVLALAAILGAVAIGSYLRRATENDLPTTVVQPPPVAVVSPQPATPTATIGETWEAHRIEDSTNGRYITAVAIAGTTLVGAGRGECIPDFTDSTACYGAAWTDVGHAGWTAAPNQPGLEMGLTVPTSGPDRSIYDLATGPAGFVAVGYDYNPPRSACAVAPCESGPAVWRSADGQTWERVHLDLGPGIIDRFSSPIVAITADDRGYVMVGYAQTLAGDGQPGAHAAAWTSPDGVAWTRATDSDDMDVGPCVDTGEEPSCGGMLDVAATATGFVAVGHAMNGNAGQGRPAAWTSPDGLTWTLASNGLDFDGRLSAVSGGGPGMVAVGTICQPDCIGSNAGGVAATSSDGSEWTSVPVTGAPGLEAIAFTRGQQFAIGTRVDHSQGGFDLELWRSDDGVAWRRETGLPTMQDADEYISSDIASSIDRVVVVVSAHVGGFASIQNMAYSSPPAGAPTEAVPSPSPAAT